MGHMRYKQNKEAQKAVSEFETNQGMIDAQAEGAPLIIDVPERLTMVLAEVLKMRDMLNEAIGKYDGSLELVRPGETTESNFGLYVDGYTLSATDKIGELKITDYAGATVTVPSKQLTAWMDRRLTPPNYGTEE